MKISIGSKIIDGPFGGGNEFLKNLTNYIEKKGHTVVNSLVDDDIDIILLTNPLFDSATSTFNNIDIEYYLTFKNNNSLVFQRFNECDERKNTNHVNKKLIKSNRQVDMNIFVSDWLKHLFENLGVNKEKNFSILGGPSGKKFNSTNKIYWTKNKSLKIVTHHWSSNFMKGFDIYSKLDSLVKNNNLDFKIEFTYIGNIPDNVNFKNTSVVSSMRTEKISNELKKHDIYITGSINEPSGNHHMEGAMSGLPILYRDSGGLPEYCKEFGVEIDIENIEESILLIVNQYDHLVNKLKKYPFTFEFAAKEYLSLFSSSLENREEIVNKRVPRGKAIVLLSYSINKLRKFLYKYYVIIRQLIGSIKKIRK